MSCDACTSAERMPGYSRYRAACRGCAIRELANGPHFYAGGLDGGNAGPYRKRLALIFGDGWRAGHELVKAEHRRIKEGGAIL